MSLGGPHVVTTVTNTEVEPTVRSHHQSMHIVPAKGNVDSIAGMQTLARIRFSIAVCISQFPEIRNAGVVDIVADRQHPSAGSLY